MLWQIAGILFLYIICLIFFLLVIWIVTGIIHVALGEKATDINELKAEIERERIKLKIQKNTEIDLIIGELHEYWVGFTPGVIGHFELSIGSDMGLASTRHEMYHIYRLIKLGCPRWTLLLYIREEFLAEVYCFTNLDITKLLARK